MTKKAKSTHVLVLRFSALGDVAMMVPVLLAVTRKYPELKITISSRAFHKPLFDTIKNVSFYEADLKARHKGVLGLWKLASELKKLHINAVADLHDVLRSNILKLFFKLSAIQFIQINKGRAEKAVLIRTKNKNLHQLKTTHQRYADVFEKLGYPVTLNNTLILSKESLSKKVISFAGTKKEKWIGIAPFAAHKGKMYSLQYMKKVIQELVKTNQYKIIVFGAGDKEERQLEQLVNDTKTILNCAGKMTFSEELKLISYLDLMISMDSANAHLASNYGVPVITLWGVTHPYAGFYPFGQPLSNALLSNRADYPLIPTSIYGNKVPKGYDKVMNTISIEAVLTKIKEVLER